VPQQLQRRPAPECESIASRHKKGCALAAGHTDFGNNAWKALNEQEEKTRTDRMTRHQYNQAKTAHKHGMDPTSIAHEMNLTSKKQTPRSSRSRLKNIQADMIRPCLRCRLNTEQYKIVEGQVLRWICRKCNCIAWVGVLPAKQ
jgi:hypothetical protein